VLNFNETNAKDIQQRPSTCLSKKKGGLVWSCFMHEGIILQHALSTTFFFLGKTGFILHVKSLVYTEISF
jgi:hypothetical protein